MDYSPTTPRGPINASFSGPGPRYKLPGLVGGKTCVTKRQMPSYLFGTRHRSFITDSSPGPCHNYPSKVTRRGNDGTPHYSLYDRPKDISTFQTPGPGAYSPENAGPTAYPRAPQSSFGSRTKGSKVDQSPAPNCYMPTLKTKVLAPSFSFRDRPKGGGFDEDLAKTPGPGSHNTVDPSVCKKASPCYSLTARNILPSDNTRKPGPGAHSPEKVTITKRSAPKFHFGIRHSEYTLPIIEATAE